MQISQEQLEDGTVVVSLEGRLDPVTVACVEERLGGLTAQGPPRLILDLAQLSYISSAGLRVLLTTAKQLAARQGKLLLCAPQRHVKEVFDISGFSTILTICESRAQALGG